MKNKSEHRQRDRMKDHCARWTAPREEIFSLLIRSQRHLSVKEIYALLHPENPDIGLTTVYRTLDLLDKANLVRKINTGDGQGRYEYNKGDHSDHHHHLICTECGKILNYRDFEKEELDLVRKTEEILAKKHGFLIRDHNIEFLGLCEECRPGGKRSKIR
ncbi:MAG: transcriptional repressor [Candidatus Aminicenantales bacterium]|jgi:Fur family ferric uptake transcriptional regulator